MANEQDKILEAIGEALAMMNSQQLHEQVIWAEGYRAGVLAAKGQ